ncbi:MAG TPA: hypothetical protein VLE73_05165 [Candidatus Saccharimonadales bacterium]|nr:hypothetical protein [Candidatus Saccharimonadales bacterium]
MVVNCDPQMPDRVAEAVLSGNLQYPQAGWGIAVFGGRAAMDELVAGTAEWRSIVFATPTDEQRAAQLKAVGRAHKAFDIAYRHVDDPGAVMPKVFDSKRLDGLATSFIWPFTRVVADYAALVDPKIEQIPRDVGVYVDPKTVPNYEHLRRLKYQAMDAFVGPYAGDAAQRPEALALHGLYTAAHEIMNHRDSAVGELANQRMPFIRLIHIAGKHSVTRCDAYAALCDVNDKLTGMIADGVWEAVPDIRKQTGARLPDQAVERFVEIMIRKSTDQDQNQDG